VEDEEEAVPLVKTFWKWDLFGWKIDLAQRE